MDDLTLKAPNTREFSGRIWPVFVNSTRTCYQLFKALALPVSPSSQYTLELLARAWRCVTRQVLERFTPMGTGGLVRVSNAHYTKHLLGPLNTLAQVTLISESERCMMIKVLHKGVLPCFAGQGDSVPDRLVSSTIALTFAACGLRVVGHEDSEGYDRHSARHTVTSAGLLYFAAWYVLVYVGMLHIQPVLKKRLSQTGSDADKHLCAALNLNRAPGGSDSHVVLDHSEIVHALRIVFGNLIDTGTVLRIAELYVPELLAQLPYTEKLNQTPASVKSAIETRDIWFAKEHGNVYPEQGEPRFTYLGNLAHGLHSSIQGTLTRSLARPIAQALCGPGNEFDPWCDTLRISEDENGYQIDSMLHMACRDESVETFECVDGQSESEEQDVWRYPSPICESAKHECHNETIEPQQDASADGERVRPQGPRRICKGLVVDVDKFGFRESCIFLTNRNVQLVSETNRDTSPSIKNPCMVSIASTVYGKSPGTAAVTACACSHGTLIEALWVLFMHSTTNPITTSASTETAAAAAGAEPLTPEALAVMAHLAVKSFNCDDSILAVCNDIRVLFEEPCDNEDKFIPVTAIIGGLFGVNIELNFSGYNYYIVNSHYTSWAPGSLCYNMGLWHVMVHGLNLRTVHAPQEMTDTHCYHKGTLRAYVRLNNLNVVKVPSDNHCGFHTVAALVGLDYRRVDRKTLIDTTVKYIESNSYDEGIKSYLSVEKVDTEGLTDHLMQYQRWLSVDEVSLMLKAHGKFPVMITEHSFPIYNPDHSHFLFTKWHYEPVMSISL